ncbi:glycosyltransferase family 8 protein [Paramixta manurensis]
MDYRLADSVSAADEIDYSSPLQDNVLNVTYGVDENYQFGVAISIVSLLTNNKDKQFCFHLFLNECQIDYRNKLNSIAKYFNTKIVVYIVSVDFFSKLPSTKIWSYAMYFRLLAFEYLGQSLKRVLYLDADVFCKGSVDQLVTLDLEDNIAAVVKDLSSTLTKSTSKLGQELLSGVEYFNSGVMLVNLSIWRACGLTNIAIDMLLDPEIGGKVKYPDQDILNIILNEKVIYLPKKFNCIYSIKNELNDRTHLRYRDIIKEDTILIHYTGITKPWHEWADYPSTKYFYDAFKLSPWDKSGLKKAISVTEKQKEYKHRLAKKEYVLGLYKAISYNLSKLKNKWF